MGIGLFSNENYGFGGTSGIEKTAIDLREGRLSWDRQTLDYLHSKSWACQRVCNLKPNLMAAAWGDVRLDTHPEIVEKLTPQLTKLKNIYRKGQQLANLYGGATAIRYVNNDTDWALPINLKQVKTVDYSRIYDKWEIYPDTSKTNINNDPENPEFYRYNFIYNGQPQINEIHHSRIIRFRGASLPPQAMIENDYWENSLLEIFLEPYLEYYNAKKNVSMAIKSFSLPVIKKSGLLDILSMEFSRGAESIKSRLATVFAQLSSNKGVALDSDSEEITFLDRSFAGLDSILEMLHSEMVASSGLTKPQLLKEHPNGLSATGESERLAEAQDLLALQNEQWDELIRQDLALLLAQYKIYDGYDWEWTNSYQNTPSEDIILKEKQCSIDEKYIAMNVYNELEVRESRFSHSVYSMDMILNDSLYDKEKTEIKEEIEEMSAEDKTDEVAKFILSENEKEVLPVSFYDESLENLEDLEDE
jgi:phage-related protein (TIGR01555 family)